VRIFRFSCSLSQLAEDLFQGHTWLAAACHTADLAED
jgi:hypothetical protein